MTDLSAMTLPELRDHLVSTGLVLKLVELAREEDLGPDLVDVTSLVSVDGNVRVEAAIVAREGGIAAGLGFVGVVLDKFAPSVLFYPKVQDGDRFKPGTELGSLIGSRQQVLAAERVILNMVGRLSGIASQTARYVEAMGSEGGAKLLDTRKTTPGFRVFEKYAVRCGGGHCHRLGLHDAVLIKDNHLAGIGEDAVGAAVGRAARLARERDPVPAFVEVEADSLEQVDAFLSIEPGLVDIILLDNMPPAVLCEAIAMRDRLNPDMLLEASGGIALDTIAAVAATGVDRISCGSLTHGAISIDIGLDIGEDVELPSAPISESPESGSGEA